MRQAGDPCLLEERICIECGECDRCELDPNKICNNCCKCIEEPQGDYAEIVIDDILLSNEDLRKSATRTRGHRLRLKTVRE